VYVANGPGKALAAKAVSTACDGLPITKIVSTGFCGALAPSLSIGAIVIANRVEEKGSGQVYSTSSMVSPGGVIGAIVTCDRVAVTVEEKKSLASGGAIAVEMEAAAVAAEATRRRVPFYCIRVVSDTAQENMPLDFNRYRRADGRFDRTGIAVAALLRPFTRIPALRTLQRNCRAASAQLGDFVAKCNF
jgi:adenosylhomocysteine nucleosidase